eukprot:scaffold3043_cov121-Cylindrotheca_fusiformis.AAC.5
MADTRKKNRIRSIVQLTFQVVHQFIIGSTTASPGHLLLSLRSLYATGKLILHAYEAQSACTGHVCTIRAIYVELVTGSID